MLKPFLRFDFPAPFCFAEPRETITAETVAEVIPALHRIQEAVDGGQYAAGFVAYEAAPAFDSALRVRPPCPGLPLLWFGIFAEPLGAPEDEESHGIVDLDWQPDTNACRYQQDIDSLHEGIAAGEFYQVNHTFRLRAKECCGGRGLYHRLTKASGANYSAFLDLGRYQILSASPELFFHRQGTHLLTRPMKGTRQRGRWQEEDRIISGELSHSEKDRAENVMIVDLLRSDLGRIARAGSVRVPHLFEIECYPTLWQMTSTIEADIAPETSLAEIFSALFPCGSVTGAPKVSAMLGIAALETSPRGPYCGSIGYMTPSGEAVFNVAIRTALLDTQEDELCYGIGGGIVWDSTAKSEYREALSKAAILSASVPAFELLETLRWEAGKYALRERHLDRLLSSAAYFGIALSATEVENVLDAAAKDWGCAARRVRLLVATDGKPRLDSTPFLPLPAGPLAVALADTPVSRHDPFLCHKTTHRAVYEAQREAQREAHPEAFDVLLWNEEGELTEFTIGNLVVEREGRHWTPPRECGLLNGTFRAELLAQGRIQERVLRPEDLQTAASLWLINSVRGFVSVNLLPGSIGHSSG